MLWVILLCTWMQHAFLLIFLFLEWWENYTQRWEITVSDCLWTVASIYSLYSKLGKEESNLSTILEFIESRLVTYTQYKLKQVNKIRHKMFRLNVHLATPLSVSQLAKREKTIIYPFLIRNVAALFLVIALCRTIQTLE